MKAAVASLIFSCLFVFSYGTITRQFINNPPAGAPFSQAVVLGGRWVFISGQQGIDPKTGKIVSGGPEAETRQALKNIEALLRKAGGTRRDIAKLTNYLKDINDLPEVNKAYPKFFTNRKYPARASFQVASLPAEGRIEIDAVAVIDNS